jgi:hypothetical protein
LTPLMDARHVSFPLLPESGMTVRERSRTGC